MIVRDRLVDGLSGALNVHVKYLRLLLPLPLPPLLVLVGAVAIKSGALLVLAMAGILAGSGLAAESGKGVCVRGRLGW